MAEISTHGYVGVVAAAEVDGVAAAAVPDDFQRISAGEDVIAAAEVDDAEHVARAKVGKVIVPVAERHVPVEKAGVDHVERRIATEIEDRGLRSLDRAGVHDGAVGGVAEHHAKLVGAEDLAGIFDGERAQPPGVDANPAADMAEIRNVRRVPGKDAAVRSDDPAAVPDGDVRDVGSAEQFQVDAVRIAIAPEDFDVSVNGDIPGRVVEQHSVAMGETGLCSDFR